MSVVYTILVATITILSSLLLAIYELWMLGVFDRIKEWFSYEKAD